MTTYEVIVGNIGTVYSGEDWSKATSEFDEYKNQSREGIGRAAGEYVTLMEDGEPLKEHYGTQHGETIDITPESLKTPEGRARVAEAQREWDQVTHELANAVSQFDEEHSVLTPGVAREMREDWHQIRTLIDARQRKQEAFLRAVASAPLRDFEEMTAERLRSGRESDGERVTFGSGPLFRELSPDEEEEFRQYARDHEPSEHRDVSILHPVCRDEWRKLGKL